MEQPPTLRTSRAIDIQTWIEMFLDLKYIRMCEFVSVFFVLRAVTVSVLTFCVCVCDSCSLFFIVHQGVWQTYWIWLRLLSKDPFHACARVCVRVCVCVSERMWAVKPDPCLQFLKTDFALVHRAFDLLKEQSDALKCASFVCLSRLERRLTCWGALHFIVFVHLRKDKKLDSFTIKSKCIATFPLTGFLFRLLTGRNRKNRWRCVMSQQQEMSRPFSKKSCWVKCFKQRAVDNV